MSCESCSTIFTINFILQYRRGISYSSGNAIQMIILATIIKIRYMYSKLFFIHWNMFVICFFDQRNIFNKLHPHIGSRYNCSQMTDNTRPYLQRISVKPHNLRKMKLSTLTSTILLHIPLCHL